MTDKQLRALQDDFLQLLEDLGHFKREGMNNPLFDKSSPTALQVKKDLWPAYTQHFLDFIKQWRRPEHGKSKRQSGSTGRRSNIPAEPDPERPEEARQAPRSVRQMFGIDPRGEAGEDVSKVPEPVRRLLSKNPSIR